jgi:hypothetical protein
LPLESGLGPRLRPTDGRQFPALWILRLGPTFELFLLSCASQVPGDQDLLEDLLELGVRKPSHQGREVRFGFGQPTICTSAHHRGDDAGLRHEVVGCTPRHPPVPHGHFVPGSPGPATLHRPPAPVGTDIEVRCSSQHLHDSSTLSSYRAIIDGYSIWN